MSDKNDEGLARGRVTQRVPPPPHRPPSSHFTSSASTSSRQQNVVPQSQTTQMQQIEKLSEYVAKNGAEFEELTRQKSLDMFWWLNDFNSNEYKMYKRLLESKMGIPNSANHNSNFSPTTIVQQPPSTMPVTNNIQTQIEEAKLRAQKLLESKKESKLEYVEDTTLFDNIVGNVPQNTRIANAGFQKGTYNAIDLLTAPKNVNEEMMQRNSKTVDKYFEKRMELFEYELERATNKCSGVDKTSQQFLYRNADENEDEIEELREIRRHRRRRGATNESAEEMEEKFNASRGSKRGLGMAEEEERNGEVEFLKYRNQLSRRYHAGGF
jgi:hypothetical protein